MAVLSYDPSSGRGTGYGEPDGDFDVLELQIWLNTFAGQSVEEDGKFGPATREAVIAVQKFLGMDNPNGIVDENFRTTQRFVEQHRTTQINNLIGNYDMVTGNRPDLMDQLAGIAPPNIDIDIFLDELAIGTDWDFGLPSGTGDRNLGGEGDSGSGTTPIADGRVVNDPSFGVDITRPPGYRGPDEDNGWYRTNPSEVNALENGGMMDMRGWGDDLNYWRNSETGEIWQSDEPYVPKESEKGFEDKDTTVGIIFGEEEIQVDDPEMDSFVTALVEAIGITPDQARGLWGEISDDWINDPNYSLDDVLIDLYDTEVFKLRFPGITALRNARAQAEGDDKLMFDIPTIKEYLDLEDVIMSEMTNLGQSGYDLNDVMIRITAAGVDSVEAKERFQAARRVIGTSVPEAVESKFRDWYGEAGDGNLIMAFLDPEDETGVTKSWDEIQAEVGAAEVAGWAEFKGDLDLAQSQAERINSLNQTQNQLYDSFANIKAAESLFVEKIGEEDFIAEEEGVESEFFGDSALMRRRDERIADFGGGGGAMLTQQGTGLGSA